MAASRDRASDAGGQAVQHPSREEFMMDIPESFTEPTTTEQENFAGGWAGVNAPAGGRMPPSTRTVGSRGGPIWDPDNDHDGG